MGLDQARRARGAGGRARARRPARGAGRRRDARDAPAAREAAAAARGARAPGPARRGPGLAGGERGGGGALEAIYAERARALEAPGARRALLYVAASRAPLTRGALGAMLGGGGAEAEAGLLELERLRLCERLSESGGAYVMRHQRARAAALATFEAQEVARARAALLAGAEAPWEREALVRDLGAREGHGAIIEALVEVARARGAHERAARARAWWVAGSENISLAERREMASLFRDAGQRGARARPRRPPRRPPRAAPRPRRHRRRRR